MAIPFGKYSEDVVGCMATTLSPMYVHVFRKHWNTQFQARVKRNYYQSDFDEGLVECYVPTFASLETNMKYHRIVVKVLPQISKEIMETEGTRLDRTRDFTPAGTIDSTTVFLVSPRLTKRGFIRSRKLPANTYLCPVVSPNPRTAVDRIIRILAKFYEKRLRALMGSFNLDSLMEWRGSITNTLLYIVKNVIEKISSDLAIGAECMVHSIRWLEMKLRELRDQNELEHAVLKVVLRVRESIPMVRRLRRVNGYDFEGCSQLLRSLECIASVGR